MLTFNVSVTQELERLISDEIQTLILTISHGNVVDHSDYKHKVGMIAGLRMALELCETATSNIQRGNDRG
jgi:hypothetical protein